LPSAGTSNHRGRLRTGALRGMAIAGCRRRSASRSEASHTGLTRSPEGPCAGANDQAFRPNVDSPHPYLDVIRRWCHDLARLLLTAGIRQPGPPRSRLVEAVAHVPPLVVPVPARSAAPLPWPGRLSSPETPADKRPSPRAGLWYFPIPPTCALCPVAHSRSCIEMPNGFCP